MYRFPDPSFNVCGPWTNHILCSPPASVVFPYPSRLIRTPDGNEETVFRRNSAGPCHWTAQFQEATINFWRRTQSLEVISVSEVSAGWSRGASRPSVLLSSVGAVARTEFCRPREMRRVIKITSSLVIRNVFRELQKTAKLDSQRGARNPTRSFNYAVICLDQWPSTWGTFTFGVRQKHLTWYVKQKKTYLVYYLDIICSILF
jgi:hypothetical protein